MSKPGSRGAFRGLRGKSELRRAGCWVTPSEGDLKESATEIKPPLKPEAQASPWAARMKRCGKSAPAGG